MRWLVTRGCGFIGAALVRDLVREGGHAVRVLDSLKEGRRADLGAVCGFVEGSADGPFPEGGVELVVGDVLDEGLVMEAADGADATAHLAANTGVAPSVEDPRSDCVTNVVGTLNCLEAARHNGVSRFVFASSGAPLGEVEPPLHEELAPRPVSPYGASKLAGEGYCSAYFGTYGVETVALRFGNVYGPGSGRKNSAVARFVRRAMAGEDLQVYGDGTQTRDFVYVEDLVRAIRLAVSVPGIGGEVFQIATSAETSVGGLLDGLLPVLDAAGIAGVEVRHEGPRLGDVRRNYSDTSKASRVLGWRAEVDLREGLRRTVEWFVDGGAAHDGFETRDRAARRA